VQLEHGRRGDAAALIFKARIMHKYSVGEVLDLLPSRGSSSRRAGGCKIVALLPYEGQAVQYRVQSEVENYQRIVSENDLRVPGSVL
jgi:hypothetical protein